MEIEEVKSVKTLMLVAALALPGWSQAHGENASAPPATTVKKEQKPWGVAGEAKAVRRTIEVRMTDDMRFTPDRFEVRRGETVRIVLRNDGRMLHEFVLGTKSELDAHAALMVRFPNMEHDEPYMVHVPAGKTGEIVWTFNRAGDFDFACLIAGHYQAGMAGTVRVLDTRVADRSEGGATGQSREAAR